MRKWILLVFPIFFITLVFLLNKKDFSKLPLSTPQTSQFKNQDQPGSIFSISSMRREQAPLKNRRAATIPAVKKPSLPPALTEQQIPVMYSVGSRLSSTSSPALAFTGTKQVSPSFIPGISPFVSFSLNFVNEQIIEHNLSFQNSIVGGLSALAYDVQKNIFIALSDDKGNKGGRPRFYKLKLGKQGKTYEFQFIERVYLKNKEGESFLPIDPEGISFFNSHKIFISSEGAQTEKIKTPPALFVFNSKGKWETTWPLPNMYWPEDLSDLGQWGVRENKAFEALSVDPDKKILWAATESALHQDKINPKKNEQYIRISEFNIRTTRIQAQFIYPLEARIERDHLKGSNGLTDFISLGRKKLLTVERAYLKDETLSGNRKTDANSVRLFLTDCFQASDVSQYSELREGKIVTCGKSLLVDLSSFLGDRVDNIEGIVMGPAIEKGKYLLVLVSDNNFNLRQRTQLLFFEYAL